MSKKNVRKPPCYKILPDGNVSLGNDFFERIRDIGGLARSGPVIQYLAHIDEVANVVTAHAEFSPFLRFLKKKQKQAKLDFETHLRTGAVLFDELFLLFKKDDEIFVVNDDAVDEPFGGKVVSVTLAYGFGVYFRVEYTTIGIAKGKPALRTREIRVYAYEGLRSLARLSCRPLSPDAKKELSCRGEKFRSYTAKASYLNYDGVITRVAWFGNMRFRATGRVMVDALGMKQADPNYMSQYNYDYEDAEDVAIRDDVLWMTEPSVFGFSFNTKKWGELSVSNLREVSYRAEAFEKLVLDSEQKRSIMALVQNGGKGFSDVIDGKGGGCIFLLHGSPGLGKTMTAEAVAEVLKRPLYSISTGELGVDPVTLEKSLRGILDIAAVWNAVILLDEADVYLEQRDEQDIVRNAMVGVFLRLLEYHSGVLFLTTNRVKHFDEAFFSRITMALHYPELDADRRQLVWKNLLGAAGIAVPQATTMKLLSIMNMNGRQIKNAIRAAQALATDGKVEESDLLAAAKMTLGNSEIKQHEIGGNNGGNGRSRTKGQIEYSKG